MKLPFAFFDYSEPRVFFLADYLAVMILVAMLGFGIMSMLKDRSKSWNILTDYFDLEDA